MRDVAWSEGTWTRPPQSIREEGRELLVEAIAESDWWRNTSYGFIHDDGHALLRDFPQDSSVEVSFILDYAEQFDQCGIFISHSSHHWVKAAVEYCDGAPQVGAVVTIENSDWSVAPVPEWFGKEVTIRASRSTDAITIRAGINGALELVRVAPLDPVKEWRAGPLICAPSRAGLIGRFTGWKVGSADGALH